MPAARAGQYTNPHAQAHMPPHTSPSFAGFLSPCRLLAVLHGSPTLSFAPQYSVGPGPDSITVHNGTSVSWRMLNTIYSTHHLVKARPLVDTIFVDFEVAKVAPLALQVSNCAELRVSAGCDTVVGEGGTEDLHLCHPAGAQQHSVSYWAAAATPHRAGSLSSHFWDDAAVAVADGTEAGQE